ncbi:hypothetical protein BDV37DRAFT_63031 [Aspergillus pseudonomiae]|uniref:Uncharacterized protein n=1 Tax=Aspergillus pseudonomiae TaxID=1506151 RepID=A0A5N7DIT7_9EURO|nr:uncharacterized protein BDV37DRAFT_63031 [Aspergillus pseudonomiae]KAE8406361.1 hypothetical protein BDV37DRAFT_63031 [Aspergillus pseudonomiae]
MHGSSSSQPAKKRTKLSKCLTVRLSYCKTHDRGVALHPPKGYVYLCGSFTRSKILRKTYHSNANNADSWTPRLHFHRTRRNGIRKCRKAS